MPLDSISARLKITLKQPNLQEFIGRLKPLPKAVDKKQIEEDKRIAYSLAIQILLRLWGKNFGGNSLLPGHLWFKRDEHWFEIAKRLGDIGSSGFKPHVSPAQIQSVDEGTLDDAVSILRLYLWSARENPTFAEIQVKHKLPLAAPVKELVESLGFSDDL